jgi:hypothetical protein
VRRSFVFLTVAGMGLWIATTAPALAASTWTVVPSPNVSQQANYLSGVAAISSTEAWAVGAQYRNRTSTPAPLAEHWNGSSWTLVPIPSKTANYNELFAVDASSTTDVWGVGYWLIDAFTERTLAEHWDGTAWSIVGTPNVGAASNALSGVAAVSPTDAWAVGISNSANINDGHALIEHWDGARWSVVRTPNPGAGKSELLAVTATSSTDVWAVGEHADHTLVEHWNGSTWSIVPSPDGAFGASALNAVSAFSSTDAWAVGGSGQRTLSLHWDGAAWSAVDSPNGSLPETELTGVVSLGTSDVWAVGYSANELQVTFRTFTAHWDGASWTVVASPNPSSEYDYLEAVDAVRAAGATVWATGAADISTLVMRTNGG